MRNQSNEAVEKYQASMLRDALRNGLQGFVNKFLPVDSLDQVKTYFDSLKVDCENKLQESQERTNILASIDALKLDAEAAKDKSALVNDIDFSRKYNTLINNTQKYNEKFFPQKPNLFDSYSSFSSNYVSLALKNMWDKMVSFFAGSSADSTSGTVKAKDRVVPSTKGTYKDYYEGTSYPSSIARTPPRVAGAGAGAGVDVSTSSPRPNIPVKDRVVLSKYGTYQHGTSPSIASNGASQTKQKSALASSSSGFAAPYAATTVIEAAGIGLKSLVSG